MDIKKPSINNISPKKEKKSSLFNLFIKCEFGWLMIWIIVFMDTVWPRNHWPKIWTDDLIWYASCILFCFIFLADNYQQIKVTHFCLMLQCELDLLNHGQTLVLPPCLPKHRAGIAFCPHKLVRCPTQVNWTQSLVITFCFFRGV